MATPDTESGYDTGQPFLERIKLAVASTRIESPHIEFRADGAYRTEGTEWWSKDSVDGMGTKGLLHWERRTFREGAQDAFAMAVNDLYRERCIPYKLTDVVLLGTDDHDAIATYVEGLAELSVEQGIQIGDGESAVLNVLKGSELDVTIAGREVSSEPNRYRPGDILIGIPSSGIHSNGWTRIRRLFPEGITAEMMTPTRIYDEVASLHGLEAVHGLTHVTGDAFRKLTVNGPDVAFYIDTLPETTQGEIFDEIYARWKAEEGLPAADQGMHLEYNNGVGFILGVSPKAADRTLETLPDSWVIGEVRESENPGVHIRSRFTGRSISL
jgi:phosphoribosylformylglycinamidine cyclo-ligase